MFIEEPQGRAKKYLAIAISNLIAIFGDVQPIGRRSEVRTAIKESWPFTQM
jgi:hypothetical protein